MTEPEKLRGDYHDLWAIPSVGSDPVLLGATGGTIHLYPDRYPTVSCIIIAADDPSYDRISLHELVIDSYDDMDDTDRPTDSYVFTDPTVTVYPTPLQTFGHLTIRVYDTLERIEVDE